MERKRRKSGRAMGKLVQGGGRERADWREVKGRVWLRLRVFVKLSPLSPSPFPRSLSLMVIHPEPSLRREIEQDKTHRLTR